MIPEPQLRTWSNRGAVNTAQSTHESVRSALASTNSAVRGKDFEVFLQGSYKNDTNIRGDSDVDIVVQLNSTFQCDLSALTQSEQRRFHSEHSDATCLLSNFRSGVFHTLQSYYGASRVQDGNKAIKVAGDSGRLPADVLPCLQLRKYVRFTTRSDQNFIEGITFDTQSDHRRVINYPKPHYKNGVGKNSDARTVGRYKQLVRVFKNARTYLIDRGRMDTSVAPSYFLESFTYNAADRAFGGSFQQSFAGVLKDLLEGLKLSRLFTCGNGQVPLFANTPEQWSRESAEQTLRALLDLWNGW